MMLGCALCSTGSQRVSPLKQGEPGGQAGGYAWCRCCNPPCPGASGAAVSAPGAMGAALG